MEKILYDRPTAPLQLNMEERMKKGKWYLIQGTIFYRGLFYSTRKKESAMRMMRCRFPASKNRQDFEHTCIVNHAEILSGRKGGIVNPAIVTIDTKK